MSTEKKQPVFRTWNKIKEDEDTKRADRAAVQDMKREADERRRAEREAARDAFPESAPKPHRVLCITYLPESVEGLPELFGYFDHKSMKRHQSFMTIEPFAIQHENVKTAACHVVRRSEGPDVPSDGFFVYHRGILFVKTTKFSFASTAKYTGNNYWLCHPYGYKITPVDITDDNEDDGESEAEHR